MVAYFRRRATAAAVAAGLVSLAGIFVLANDADYLFDGLTSRALPLVILSAVCGLGALVLLTRGAAAARAWPPWAPSAGVVVAWGVAQWDYLLPDVPDRLRGRRAVRHHRGRAGGHRPRRGPDRARLRAALRARPEVAAARGGHARAR